MRHMQPPDLRAVEFHTQGHAKQLRHTLTHTHMRKHVHTHTHTHTHAYTHTYTHSHAHIHKHARTHTCSQSLLEAIKFDHGYTSSSPVVTSLLEVLSELDLLDQRRFLRFVTGAWSVELWVHVYQVVSSSLHFVTGAWFVKCGSMRSAPCILWQVRGL